MTSDYIVFLFGGKYYRKIVCRSVLFILGTYAISCTLSNDKKF